MRMLVVGAGSTGGYFGGRLAQAGRDVTFLVHAARAKQLAERGLQIVSPHGDLTLRPQLVTAETLAGPYDAILLTVKAFSLEGALKDMAPAVGAKTLILPVLNGMKHVDTLVNRFGKQSVVGCACKIAGLSTSVPLPRSPSNAERPSTLSVKNSAATPAGGTVRRASC